MQSRFPFTLLLLLNGVGAGCNWQDSSSAALPPSRAFSAQLEAATAIMNPIQRDEGLSSVALAAADAGDGTVALAAVDAMMNPIQKDDVAAQAARKLASAGKGAEATAVAKSIRNPIKRDETLLELSRG